MSYWAVKTPSGILVTSTVNEDRTRCYEGYTDRLLTLGAIKDRPDWYGPGVYTRHWRVLRDAGYSCVMVKIYQRHHAASNWRYPQLVEIR